jgi:two-component system osmolarity sensor histidine kinase EnvZ
MLRLNLQADDSFLLSAATLDRLLSNLVDNAYHYGQPPVTISTGRRGKSWFLSVTDEGEGIPEAAIGTASRPFVRLDPARGGNAHCGLGLAIVERLATRAQGECLLSTGAAEKEPRDGSHAAAKDGQKDAVSDAAGLCVELRFPMLAG